MPFLRFNLASKCTRSKIKSSQSVSTTVIRKPKNWKLSPSKRCCTWRPSTWWATIKFRTSKWKLLWKIGWNGPTLRWGLRRLKKHLILWSRRRRLIDKLRFIRKNWSSRKSLWFLRGLRGAGNKSIEEKWSRLSSNGINSSFFKEKWILWNKRSLRTWNCWRITWHLAPRKSTHFRNQPNKREKTFKTRSFKSKGKKLKSVIHKQLWIKFKFNQRTKVRYQNNLKWIFYKQTSTLTLCWINKSIS